MIRDEQRTSGMSDDVYQALQKQGGNVFALTAPKQNCGVAKCTAQLALRYAEAGMNVLVVDFNLIEPKLHKCFGIEQIEWWPGDPAAAAAIQKIEAGISVLAAPDFGGAHVAFHERMTLQVALKEWGQSFDRVLLCAPPLLDDDPDQMPAEVLCSLTDGAVLVVKGAHSTVPEIQSLKQRLEQSGASILGAVLNDEDNVPVLYELDERLARLERFAPRIVRGLRKLVSKSFILNAYR